MVNCLCAALDRFGGFAKVEVEVWVPFVIEGMEIAARIAVVGLCSNTEC